MKLCDLFKARKREPTPDHEVILRTLSSVVDVLSAWSEETVKLAEESGDRKVIHFSEVIVGNLKKRITSLRFGSGVGGV